MKRRTAVLIVWALDLVAVILFVIWMWWLFAELFSKGSPA